MRFKKGDRVKIVKCSACNHKEDKSCIGNVGTIISVDGPFEFPYILDITVDHDNFYRRSELELVTEEKVAEEEEPRIAIHHLYRHYMGIDLGFSPRRKPMAKLSTLAKKLLDPDTKALVKAGVLNNELEVEDEEFVLSYLVNLHKEGLAKEARKKLREEKKDEEEV